MGRLQFSQLLVNMWETLNPVYEELKRRRNEVNALKLDIKLWNKKGEKFNDDLMMVQKALDMKDEANKSQVEDHRRQRQKLVFENDSLIRQLKELRGIQSNTIEIHKDNQRLKDENDALKHKVHLLMPTDSEDPSIIQRVGDIEVQKILLKKENEYLSKKDIQLSEQDKSATMKIKQLESDLEDVRQTSQKYLRQLLHNKQINETEAYKKIDEALQKQKMHHYEDLVRQRDNMVSEYEARLSLFKDQRDEAELKFKRLESDYNVLKVQSPYFRTSLTA